jgi:hypothetical protein
VEQRSIADGAVLLYALLKHEQHAPDFFIESDYMVDEWEAVATAFNSDLAVRCPRGLPRQKAIAA